MTACESGNKEQEAQVERVKTGVFEARNALYEPKDAKLLAEVFVYGSNPKLKNGCMTGFIYIAYQVPRNFEELLAEYQTELKVTGWELSPYYRHVRDYIDFFVQGTQTALTVSSTPLRPDLLIIPAPTTASNQTVYYIAISYDDPSTAECQDG
jgi:hypothetical protein